MRALGEVAPASSNALPAPSEVVWNLSLEDIEGGSGRILARQKCRVSELGSSKCAFDSSHVLYSKLRPYLNKVVVPDETGVGTSELIPMKPDPAILDREYLALYLRSPVFLEFSEAHTRGANLPRIAMNALWQHRVPVPLLQEQRRIVARVKALLERVEELDTLRRVSGTEVAAVFPSLLADRFSATTKRSDLARIGDVALESRYGTSRKCNSDSRGIPILRIPNVADGIVNIGNLKFCSLDKSELRTLLLQDGDLLIVRTNGSPDLVGRCAVFSHRDRDYAFASYLIRIRLDGEKADPQFVAFFLESTSGRDAIAAIRKTSAGQYNVNSENLRAIKFPCPGVATQRKMVEQMLHQREVLSQIRHHVADRLAETVPLRAGILRRAFAGEL